MSDVKFIRVNGRGVSGVPNGNVFVTQGSVNNGKYFGFSHLQPEGGSTADPSGAGTMQYAGFIYAPIVFSSLVIKLDAPPNTGNSITFTIYKNGSATSITGTLSTAEDEKTITNLSGSFTTYDLFSVKVATTGTPESSAFTLAMICAG